MNAVIVPIGGGGLISGMAYTLKTLNPCIKVYGVQAAGAPSMRNSIHDAHIERLDSVRTIADGIAVKEPGSLTYDLCSKYVDEIVTVSDDEISAAILALMEQHKRSPEGAGRRRCRSCHVRQAGFDRQKDGLPTLGREY